MLRKKQKQDLIDLWNRMTTASHNADKGLQKARFEKEKALYEHSLRDALAERTGLHAGILTMGCVVITDENGLAVDIVEKLGPKDRR